MTKHVPDINKQSLIIPGEWQGDKNIHNVLNNVLSDDNIKRHTVLFTFSEKAHVPFSMHQYYPKKIPFTPKLGEMGYMYPQMKKAVGML